MATCRWTPFGFFRPGRAAGHWSGPKTAVRMDRMFLTETAHQEEDVEGRHRKLACGDRHAVSQILRKPQRLAIGRADGLHDDVGRRVDEDLPQEITGDCPGEGGDSSPVGINAQQGRV